MTEAWNAARSWQKEMDVWRFYGKDKIWLSITERHLRGQEYLGSCHGKLSHDKFSQKSCFGNEMAHLLYQSRRMDRVWKSMSRVSHRCERFGKDRVHCSWWRWIARYLFRNWIQNIFNRVCFVIWDLRIFNSSFRELIGDPDRSFDGYSDVSASALVGDEITNLLREVP